MDDKRLKVMFVASEVYPLIKTGGLADVVGALPLELSKSGVDCRVVLPGYKQVKSQLKTVTSFSLGDPFGWGEVKVLESCLPSTDVIVWVIDCPNLYNREGGPYHDTKGNDFSDNHHRFALLSWAAAVLANYGALCAWQADIVHAHDWQAGLVAAYLKSWKTQHPKVVFTIHNLQYMGMFPSHTFGALGVSGDLYHVDALEFYGNYSTLKAGISLADAVTTVSPTYAQEIQTQAFGCGLDGVLRHHHYKLSGILNGVDYSIWNPETDPHIEKNYNQDSLENKTVNKSYLCQRFGLRQDGSLLLGVVSRLTEQKGLDIALEALPALLDQGVQLIVLGSGDKCLESGFLDLVQQYPEQVAVTIGYDEALSHQIQAGADAFLVPSRFEPCGLTQLYALKYGTLPVVRSTGGLADTVFDCMEKVQTGFTFSETSAQGLKVTLERVLTSFQDQEQWRSIQRSAMSQNFSWKSAACDYLALYYQLLGRDPASNESDKLESCVA